jgi:LPXTG-site transpeptidase (sortase) family protein
MKIIKKIHLIMIITLTLLTSLTLLKINNQQKTKSIIKSFIITYPQKNENIIGKIQIKSIDIDENLYNIDSEENNVDKHVTILKETIFPDKDNSIIFIAAHSGEGDIAYFNNLDKLKPNDKILLTLYNKKYKYIVKDSWEENKNGYINVNKEIENQLILTTCSPHKNNKQLIVNCIEKESN